jgi:hypothetical protein
MQERGVVGSMRPLAPYTPMPVERVCYLSGPHAPAFIAAHLGRINRSRSALVQAVPLGSRNALKLTFPA